MTEKRVGIGEIRVEQGSSILSAYGIGSCVVIILYDEEKKVGGLAHCLLPFGDEANLKCPRGAIAEALKQMSKMGARLHKIVAKIIGGAMMFGYFEKYAIGKKNVAQARKELQRLQIPVIAEEVFGNWGRSVVFKLENGEVEVKSFRHGNRII
jgi:chemotaxis protein CheD